MKEHLALDHLSNAAAYSDEAILTTYPTVIRRRVLRWGESVAYGCTAVVDSLL